MKKICPSILLLLFMTSLSFAQDSDEYQNHPGYFNFGKFDFYEKMESKVAIEVKGPLLKLVAAMSSGEEPDLAKLLGKLLLVKIDIFDMDKNKFTNVQSIISSVSKELKTKKWDQVVSVKEDDEEQVGIFTRLKGDRFIGIVIMAVNDNEAVFLNIVGDIDLEDFEQIGRLGTKLDIDIPELNGLNNINKKKKRK